MKRKPTVISLFAGVGGFDLGAERAGYEVIGQVEIDKKCQEVLRRRFPQALLHDDVTTAVAWAKESNLVGRVDIVCGGFPCQDVSVAGKRTGIAGARSGLFWDAIHFAQEVQAHTVVLENVPGLLSSNQGRDFGVVLSTLADAGYSHVEWRVLDSQFFGVPQRRRRVFIIGTSRNPRGGSILAERESVQGNPTKGRKARQKSTKSTANSTGTSGIIGSDLVGTLAARDYKGVGNQYVAENKLVVYNKSRRAQNDQDFETWIEGGVVPTLNAFDNGDIRATTLFVQAYDELNDSLSEVHHTLRAGTKQSTGVLTTSVRRLTPMECERLQGFPDNWTEGQPMTQRYKQMGNAVTVPVAQWVFERLDTLDYGHHNAPLD